MSAPLQLVGLTKRYGELVVLDGLDMEIGAGEAVAMVGPNGAGKSTLLGCVCGTVIPDEGTITIGGHDLRGAAVAARERLRYLPQEVEVPAGLTGREILAFFADAYGARKDIGRAETFADLGEALDHVATTYSVGMRRRLMFAAILPGDASLLVLDEPFAGVDPDGRARMLSALALARDRGAGVLLAAHDPSEPAVVELGARVVELGAQS